MPRLARALLPVVLLLVACGAPAQPPPLATLTADQQAARNVELTQVPLRITATAEARASATQAVPTRTPTPGPTATPTPRVIAVPDGWTLFACARAPMRIAHPEDWEVNEEDDDGEVEISFAAPDQTTQMLVYSFGAYDDFHALSKEDLRDYFDAAYGSFCDSHKTEEAVTNQIAGVSFTGVAILCEVSDIPLYMYFAAGAQGRRGWLVGYVTLEADFERNFETYFAPMFNSLELGKR